MRQSRRVNARVITCARFRALALAAAAGLWSCAALAADYRVIAEQNLFDPQRKPWPEPAAAAAASPLAADDIQVQGVVVVGRVKRAIVKLGGRLKPAGGAAGRSNTVLGEGQAVGGYTLESIEARQLVFSSGGSRYTVPFTRSVQRDMASAPPAPLPVIQSATLPVAEAAPAAQPAAIAGSPQFAPPPALTPPQAGQPHPPAPAPAPALFPSGPAQQAASTAAAPATPAAAPAPPATGMSLLQAIQAAEAARRAGQAQTAPPFNPFQPRPQP